MTEWFNALFDPAVPFIGRALLVGLLASVAFGVVGTFVVVRRIGYLAGAVSHCVLGGIGLGLYLRYRVGWEWVHPMHGAVASALASAIVLGLISLYARQREDTVIGALWAGGMAFGLILIHRTPGYHDPMVYLFGDILLLSPRDVWLVAGLDALVLTLAVFFYNKLVAVCFDEEFPRLRGVRVEAVYLLLLCLTAMTVVLLLPVVGIILVIALLTIPAAVAGHFSRRLWQMMALAVIFCMIFTTAGLGVSYHYDLPSGPVIILIAGGVYLAVAGGAWVLRRGRR